MVIHLIPYFALAAAVVGLMVGYDHLGRRAGSEAGARAATPWWATPRAARIGAEICFWTGVVIMVVFSGTRRSVGTDYPLYTQLLEQLDPSLPWIGQIQAAPQDPAFVLLSLVTLTVSDGPLLLMLVSAAMTIVPIAIMLRLSRVSTPLAFAFLFLTSLFLFPMNLVRQGIAVALSFFAWRYLDSRRRYFWLLNLIAATFHVTALVVAAIQYLTRNVRPTRTFYVVVGIAAVALVGAMLLPWEDILGDVGARYTAYIVAARANLSAIGIGTLANLAVRVATVVYTGTAPAADRLADRWQVYATLSIPFMAIGILLPVAARIELYMIPALVLLLPDVLRRRHAGALHTALLLGIGMGYFALTLVSFYGLLPYDSYLLP
ncbi:EpsG family protein [Microbacterium sp. T2.11-28]|uniref:EpsG family protein n=1 Tax=Microbacterium sp. T2.11-28 TaxID=3041169 RepID=UPI002477971F|nr:EpsG family protein [Microbacterium sp. T2.11-28]CAI9393652.1 hypothetical protein MICABA_02520 [Microbacterium sp. T2.11-28]